MDMARACVSSCFITCIHAFPHIYICTRWEHSKQCKYYWMISRSKSTVCVKNMIINIDALGPRVSEIFRVKQTIFLSTTTGSSIPSLGAHLIVSIHTNHKQCDQLAVHALDPVAVHCKGDPHSDECERNQDTSDSFQPGQLQTAFSCTHKTWAGRCSGPFTCWGESLQWLQRLWLYQRPWASAGLGGLAAACAGTCVLWGLQSDSLSPLEPYWASFEKGKAGACKPRWTRETWDKTVKP